MLFLEDILLFNKQNQLRFAWEIFLFFSRPASVKRLRLAQNSCILINSLLF